MQNPGKLGSGCMNFGWQQGWGCGSVGVQLGVGVGVGVGAAHVELMKANSHTIGPPPAVHSKSWYLIEPQEAIGSEHEAGITTLLVTEGHGHPWSMSGFNREHGAVQQRS